MRVLFSLVAEQVVASREAEVGATGYWAAEEMVLGCSRFFMSPFVTIAVFRVQEAFATNRAFVRPLRTNEVGLLMTSV